ncbi:MAG: hypothetical protein WBP54_11920 [Pelodictyon phaeoclathratiforme]
MPCTVDATIIAAPELKEYPEIARNRQAITGGYSPDILNLNFSQPTVRRTEAV